MPLTADSIQLGPWEGVRYDVPVEDVAPNELSSMSNVRLGQGGEASQRPGTLSYNSLGAVNSGATVTMCAQFNTDATTEHTVIVAGDKIYDYSSGVWTDRTNSLTVTAGDDNTWEWAECNGVLAATSAADTNGFKISGGVATALDDNSRFANGKHNAWFDNRYWVGNVNGATNKVWYSNIADIETWGATSFFNFGGIVTALIPSQNALTVHTTEGIYTLVPTGNADIPFISNKQTARAGIDGRSCVALPGDVQLMILEDGVYEWSGGSEIHKISEHLDGGYWPSLTQSRLHKAHAVYYPSENEVWFFLPFGSTNMNQAMVWNRIKRRWFGPYKGWERNCSTLIDNEVHAGDFNGFLLDHNATTNTDEGASISSRFETGAPSPMGPDVKVRWLMGRHYYDAQGTNQYITVLQRGAELVTEAKQLDLQGAGFQLDADFLDIDSLAELVQFSQDVAMQGYAPQTSIEVQKNLAGETFTHRKMFLRYKPLGRFIKDQPGN